MFYALMTLRDKDAYVELMRWVQANVCDLDPVSFMTDYEGALRNALKEVYPLCEVRGCFFHISQAVRRKASKLAGFLAELHANKKADHIFRQFLALPLLPKERIVEGFELLVRKSAVHGELFKKFVAYYERWWIKTVKKTTFIPIF